MGTLCRVSELAHLPPSLGQLSKWTALDFSTFILYGVGTVVCDGTLVTNYDFRKMIIHLANVVYLLNHGKPSPALEEQLKHEMIAFCELFHEEYKDDGCTWKYHNFQHMLETLLRHGPAFLWDSFNLEKFVGFVKKIITARRNQVDQGVTCCLLYFHSRAFDEFSTFCPSVKQYLKSFSLMRTLFASMKPAVLKYGNLEDIQVDDMNKIQQFVSSNRVVPRHETQLKRVLKLKHLTQVFTSEGVKHVGKVDDSHVMVDSRIFGQVKEIVEVKKGTACVMLLALYKKKVMRNNIGMVLDFPINSFPVVETGEVECFYLEKETFVQKIMISSFVGEFGAVKMFNVKPNEFFHS